MKLKTLLIILCFTVLLLSALVIYLSHDDKVCGDESFSNDEKGAICLLVRDPHDHWVDFLQRIVEQGGYDVYVMIDNNEYSVEEYQIRYPEIRFLQIADEICHNTGFVHVNSVAIEKTPLSWDKALYYFCIVETKYSQVWFVEDDVFVPTSRHIPDMDAKYPLADLICTKSIYNDTGSVEGWMWWQEAKKHFDVPWSGGLMCICRLSRSLLKHIADYAQKHKRLVFLEILFATLSQKNGLNIVSPEELSNVDCCEKWDFDKVDPYKIIHPVKNMEDQIKLRSAVRE